MRTSIYLAAPAAWLLAVAAADGQAPAPDAVAGGSVAASAIPRDDQLQSLVEEALMKFDAAVKAADFSDFLKSVADRWRFRGPDKSAGRITKAALEKSFRPFMDAKVDLSSVKGKKMTLDEPPSVNADGVLVLKGRHDTTVLVGAGEPRPKRVSFKLEFVFEDTKWKLFGITLNLQ